MPKKILEKVKSALGVFQSRIVLLTVFFVILFALIIHKAFELQIVQGEDYLESFKYRISKEVELKSSRGNIYDSKGNLLAYNKLAYSVVIEDSPLLTDNETRNNMIDELIGMIESSGFAAVNNIPVEIKNNGDFVYTSDETAVLRFKRNVFGHMSVDDLTQAQRDMTAKALFEYMRGKKMFNLDPSYEDEEALKIIAVRYELFMKRYEKYLSVTVCKDISDELVAKIKENSSKLPGVTVAQDYVRYYNDSKYFAHIIGYTGKMSQDQLDAFQDQGIDYYNLDDIVGKTGLESEMENFLVGQKGSQKMYVDNLGSVLEIAETVEPKAGNDLYLTIDSEQQKKYYDLLEEKIAGILLSKLVSEVDEENTNNYISIKDVYYAFIKNSIISLEQLKAEDASELEQSVNAAYQSAEATIIENIGNYMTASQQVPDGELGKDYQEYFTYIYNMLSSNGIILSGKISEEDETYSQWVKGTVSFGDFIKYALSKSWIDVKELGISDEYLDSDEVYQALITYIGEHLKGDEAFEKKVYYYLVHNDTVSGRDICLLLYDQGVLEEDDGYAGLMSGATSAYSFIYDKIYNMVITPDMLGLDPCSGSVVVTDPNTGEVKAMVSYPSYDTNRISNSVYFNSLLANESRPLYNRASLQATAPGSTFKMVTSAAALEEGIIDTEATIMDYTTFTKVIPSPSCWSKVSHGAVNIIRAIRESCNYFFYEMGYMMGTDENGNFSNTRGLEVLKKYATMFGLDRVSGIELPETEPNISTEDAVRSAIGQGTNNYTPTQLARYVTALASRGTLYNLSIIDKVVDKNGKTVVDYTPEIIDHIQLKETTWDAIFEGMYQVTQNSSFINTIGSLDIKSAGKSGTAQENETRPDHGLFLGFAPLNNPQLTATVVIPFGYESSNPGEVFRDVLANYFNLKTDKPSDGGARKAALPEATVAGD